MEESYVLISTKRVYMQKRACNVSHGAATNIDPKAGSHLYNEP
jgi:hypothetical protein